VTVVSSWCGGHSSILMVMIHRFSDGK